jgi:hypothetical protein
MPTKKAKRSRRSPMSKTPVSRSPITAAGRGRIPFLDGLIYLAILFQRDSVINHRRRVLESRPGDADTHVRLARTLAAQGNKLKP